MRCQERSGFLFAHACDREAVASCASCGKMVCHEHLRPGTTCVSCAKRAGVADPQHRVGSSRGPYDNDPYWYASSYYMGYHYYDDRDHRVFDSATDANQAGFEGDFEGS